MSMLPKKGVERQRGNRPGLWFFRTATRLTGLRGGYGLLYLVTIYYLLVDRALVSESLPYIRRRFPAHNRWRQLLDLYLLFVSQGKCLIDRFAVAAGYEGIKVEIRGYESLRETIAAESRGMILLTAHIGSWQVAMSSLKKFDRHVYVMMRPEDNAAVQSTLQLGDESERVKVILTSGALGGVIEALKAIEEGSLVTIMGDRPYDFPATTANFLGGEVSFPYGAFTLASAARCPVVVLLSAKVGTEKYIVDVSQIIPPPTGARGAKTAAINACVQQYAHILERYVAEFPFQWFVFRDIWKKPGDGVKSEE